MTALFIDRRGADIDLEGDTIVVRVEGRREGTAPLRALERVVVHGSARIGTRLVARLRERGVGLVILPARGGRPAAILTPGSGDAAQRLTQLRLADDEDRRTAFATDLVRTKIEGQASLLRAARTGGRDLRLDDAIAAIARAEAGLAAPGTVATRAALRGVEGAASAAYFRGLLRLLPKALGFKGRNRRPPRDPVNVCLSLGYTLLHHEAVQHCLASGLDPAIGVYHDPVPGRDSLACDLAEPGRSEIDRIVLALFDEGLVKVDDFSQRGAACMLGKAGREVVYRTFEERMGPARAAVQRASAALVSILRA